MTDEQKSDLYREYYGKVYGYVRGRIGDKYAAEDIAADVFVKVYERLDSFDRTKSSVSTWIFKIMQNTLTDYFRTRHVYDEIPETASDDVDGIEDDVCNRETLEKLAASLKKLDGRERDIIILRFYSGKTIAEIADATGVSASYVKVLMNRAIGVLRKDLENYC